MRPTRIPSPVRGKMSNECGNEVMRPLECQCQRLSKLAPMGKVRRGNAHRSARAVGVRSVMAGAANDRVLRRVEGIPILSYSRESCVLLWWAAAIRPTAACHGPRQNGNFGQSWIPAGLAQIRCHAPGHFGISWTAAQKLDGAICQACSSVEQRSEAQRNAAQGPRARTTQQQQQRTAWPQPSESAKPLGTVIARAQSPCCDCRANHTA
jgi:hypothetical protein